MIAPLRIDLILKVHNLKPDCGLSDIALRITVIVSNGRDHKRVPSR